MHCYTVTSKYVENETLYKSTTKLHSVVTCMPLKVL